MKTRLSALALGALAFATFGQLFASKPALADQHQCRQAIEKTNGSVVAYYDPRIAQVDKVLADIASHKGDPKGLKVKIGEEYLTLDEVREKLVRNKNAAMQEVGKRGSDCEAALKPFQDVVNGLAFLETNGLSALLPGKSGHIDVSDILAGYPLGGPDAVIPKFREDVFRTFGIGGDFAEFVRNPLGSDCSFFRRPLGGC